MRNRLLTLGIPFALILSLGARVQPAIAAPRTGTGGVVFGCQFTIMFPSAAPTPALTNCDGGANGGFAGATGKGGVYFASGLWDPVTKPGYTNYRVYNIVHSEPCVAGEPFPAIGTFSAQVTIQGTNVLTGLAAYVHKSVSVTRIGASIIALSTDIHAHNGVAVKGHTSGGSPIGPGVAVGVVQPKPPFGTCAAPAPTVVNVMGFGTGIIDL